MKTPPVIHALLIMVTQAQAIQGMFFLLTIGAYGSAVATIWGMCSLFYIGVDKPCKRDWKRAQRFSYVKTRYPY